MFLEAHFECVQFHVKMETMNAAFACSPLSFSTFGRPATFSLKREAQRKVTNVTLVVSKRDGLNLESVSSCLLLFLCSASCVVYTYTHLIGRVIARVCARVLRGSNTLRW